MAKQLQYLNPMDNQPNFLEKLKARRIFQVAAAYVVVAWLLIQVSSTILPTFNAPDWVNQAFTALLLLGLPLVVVLTWIFDASPAPGKKEASAGHGETPSATAATHNRGDSDAQSIVVIPFVNIAQDSQNDYFVDGLTEELITELSRLPALRVISRNTAMRLRHKADSMVSLVKELGVRHVLDGGVRISGNKVRVTAQLVDTNSDRQLWADKFDGEMEDIFSIQETIAFAIVDALKVRLSDQDVSNLETHPIADLRAYQCYMKARYEYGKFSIQGAERAVSYLEEALEIDPANSVLHMALGWACFNYGSAALGADIHDQYLDRARHHAEIVLKSEPESADAKGLLGLVLYDRFQTIEGMQLLKQGADDQNCSLDTLTWAAFIFSMCHQIDTARPWIDKLQAIDPLHGFSQWTIGWFYWMQGEMQRAESHLRRGLELEPSSPNLVTGLALLLVLMDRRTEAAELLHSSADQDSDENTWSEMGKVLHAALTDQRDLAHALMTQELCEDARSDMLYSWLLAEFHALLGDDRQALYWLENAIKGGFWNHVYFRDIDSLLARLRNDEEFKQLMAATQNKWNSLQSAL